MKLGNRSLSNLKGVHPNLIHVLMEAIRDTPADFTIVAGVRTALEQDALYAQGRTRPGQIVTQKDGVRNKSNHQVKADGFGYAVDLYPYVNGKVDVQNESKKLDDIAAHILATAKRLGVSIVWGGNWATFKDYPHFELIL